MLLVDCCVIGLCVVWLMSCLIVLFIVMNQCLFMNYIIVMLRLVDLIFVFDEQVGNFECVVVFGFMLNQLFMQWELVNVMVGFVNQKKCLLLFGIGMYVEKLLVQLFDLLMLCWMFVCSMSGKFFDIMQLVVSFIMGVVLMLLRLFRWLRLLVEWCLRLQLIDRFMCQFGLCNMFVLSFLLVDRKNRL